MVNAELREVHVGQAINNRLIEMGMPKAEFARRIGVQQQHVHRILVKESMDTSKLVEVCRAIDFNIFSLFCIFPTNVNAYLASVCREDTVSNNYIGDTSVLAQMEVYKERLAGMSASNKILTDQIDTLKRCVEQLNSQLKDKDEIINLLRNR
ncbi:MAG: helix-turn-helix domain-containing protein [Bacteroidaceae bacterium]|nr:helix-turn-helix domain-containing protein [Bacteroidaceae bacterium]